MIDYVISIDIHDFNTKNIFAVTIFFLIDCVRDSFEFFRHLPKNIENRAV